jgi:polysaccharide export outer membrane protein
MIKKTLLLAILLWNIVICYSFAQDKITDAQKKYVVSPNDILEITVYGEPDLSVTVRVSQDGTIIYPLLGNIKAAGFNIREIEKTITDLLTQDFLVNPQVSIFVKQYAKISILGEVRSPGTYEMKENLTLTQAIAAAGGFIDTANTDAIKIISGVGEKKETITVDIDQIMNKEIADVEIKANDTILVASYGHISIMGQVVRPGIYSLKKGLTVVEAINLAGGFSSTAAQDGTRVIRIEGGEEKKTIRANISDIIKGRNKSKDILLQEGDTIIVPESFF